MSGLPFVNAPYFPFRHHDEESRRIKRRERNKRKRDEHKQHQKYLAECYICANALMDSIVEARKLGYEYADPWHWNMARDYVKEEDRFVLSSVVWGRG